MPRWVLWYVIPSPLALSRDLFSKNCRPSSGGCAPSDTAPSRVESGSGGGLSTSASDDGSLSPAQAHRHHVVGVGRIRLDQRVGVPGGVALGEAVGQELIRRVGVPHLSVHQVAAEGLPPGVCAKVYVSAVVWLLFRVVAGWWRGPQGRRVQAWWFRVEVGVTRAVLGGGAGVVLAPALDRGLGFLGV